MKNINLPPVALQCEHPDAAFYMVGVGENSISGFFDGVLWNGKEWVNHPGQSWAVSFDTFIEACVELGVVADYERGRVWFAYDPDESKGIDAREWAAFWISENERSTELYDVLKSAIQADFRAKLNRIEDLMGVFTKQSHNVWAELITTLGSVEMNAADDLAAICQSVRQYLAQPNEQAAAASRAEMLKSIEY